MLTSEDFALAERLSARRARMATILALLFLASMATSLGTDFPASRPETIQLVAEDIEHERIAG